MLHVHRAERADRLVEALSELLVHPPEDPLAAEVVAVPTRGMERWLSQQLSARLGTSARGGDGVCANVLFPSPRRLIDSALATAGDVEADADPWPPERSLWPLLDTVEEQLGEGWLAPLAAHLGADREPPDPLRRGRRLAVVRHLAELFDGYAVHRPEMVRGWSAAEAEEWQARLWRALRRRIGLPGPAERLPEACARLRRDPELVELPQRLSLFGLTRLVRSDLHVLSALADGREVHLFLLHPSPVLWRRVADIELPREPDGLPRRRDPTTECPRHPLLASWGRDAREMQVVIGARSEPAADHHHPLELAPRTLLERIQAGVLIDTAPPGAATAAGKDHRPRLAPEDRSLQVHACHGRARQVEVVREAILHLLAEDPTLEPRDVIVMCPDIETFAPLITATFGGGEAAPGSPGEPASTDPPGSESGLGPAPPVPELRVRLADRSLRQTNPLLAVVADLLALVDGRMTASQVLDLADREPVRRRLRFDDADVAQLEAWAAETGIRWGLDQAHRAPFGLGDLQAGTWRAGLDRLLLGVTMTEEGERLVEGVLPLDDVGSGAIDLAGRFAELIARLDAAVSSLQGPQPLSGWVRALAAAVDALAAPAAHEAWQRVELQRLLDELLETAGDDIDGTPLALVEISALLGDRLAGRPTRANFRTGHLTVCTLYPMRSVPHRVVCLLGLDESAFPRQGAADGDDLLAHDPHVGERDPRSEDRQLLLDALMAARDRLLITYTAADERTNVRLPPAVPVGELLDVVDATAVPAEGRARDQVVIRHPLQPFDPRNFARGGLSGTEPWSFDPVALNGAQSLLGARAVRRTEREPFLQAPLPRLQEPIVELEEVVRFLAQPVRAFLRRRLRVVRSQEPQEIADGLAVELDRLEQWQAGQRLLEARLAGVDDRAACLAEIARGTLPPGPLGEPVIRELYPQVDAILAVARREAPSGEPEPLDVQVALDDGRRLSGTVDGLRGTVLLTTTFSRVSPRQRLSAWTQLLAATVAHPELELSALTVGRGRPSGSVRVARIPPLPGDTASRARFATEQLANLLDLYDRGMCEPLPLYARTSAAYAEAVRTGGDAVAAARGEWESNWEYQREDREAEHLRVLGGIRPLDEVLREPPRPDERGPGWPESEAGRFGRLSRLLWDGLLAHEHLSEHP